MMTNHQTLRTVLRYMVASLILFIISGSARAFADPVSSPKAASPKAAGDKWAVVVGVSKFAQGIESLPGAAKDATDFAQFLIQDCAFAADHVKLLTDDQATESGIMSALGVWTAKNAQPADLVVVYISTAGTAAKSDVEGGNFLCAFDTKPENLYDTGISAAQLPADIRKRCLSNKLVLIIDASYSGSAIASSDAERVASLSNQHSKFQDWGGAGQATLCSSQSDQRSYECKTKSNSAFTFQFMQSARKLGKDATLRQIFDETAAAVGTEVESERHAKQTPVAKFSGDAAQIQIATPPASANSSEQSKSKKSK